MPTCRVTVMCEYARIKLYDFTVVESGGVGAGADTNIGCCEVGAATTAWRLLPSIAQHLAID